MSPEQNRQVLELYTRLVDLEPGEQATQLAREPDEEVRREVASLLGIGGSTFLNSDPGDASRRAVAPARGVAGRYVIGAEVARGGMGIVYRARDLVLRREVAYKIVNEATADVAHFRRKFDREARITARFQYPGIAPVYEFVTDDSGQPAYAMQLIDGAELARLFRERPEADAATRRGWLTAGLAACRVVAHAHAHGFVHGDLSPRNLMIVGDDAAYVLDWGLARYLGAGDDVALADDLDDLVGDSPGAGSPGYTAPDVREGVPRSRGDDVYSLGAILAAMLWGVDAAGRPRPAVSPSKPAGRAIGAIIALATGADRARCYPDAHALANDLAQYLAGEPVSAYREPWSDRAARAIRRHPVGFAWGAATAALLLVALAATSQVRAANDRAAKTAVEAGAARLQAQSSRAKASMLRCSMILARHPAPTLLQDGTIDQILQTLGGLTGGAPLVSSTDDAFRIEREGRNNQTVIEEKEDRTTAEVELREAIAILEGLVGQPPDPDYIQFSLALCYSSLASQELERAINELGLSRYLLLTLGNVQGHRAELPEVVAVLTKFDRALSVLPTTFPSFVQKETGATILAGIYNHKGVALTLLGRYTEATMEYERAVAFTSGTKRRFLEQTVRLLHKAAEVEQQYLPWSVSSPPDHDRATRMADYLVDRPEVSPEAVFNAACAFALASRDVATTATQRECRARRAVDLLATVQVGGYFRAEKKAGELQTDITLDPLRARTDFRGLAVRVAADRWATIVAAHACDLASARTVVPVDPDPIRARLVAYLTEMIWPADPF